MPQVFDSHLQTYGKVLTLGSMVQTLSKNYINSVRLASTFIFLVPFKK